MSGGVHSGVQDISEPQNRSDDDPKCARQDQEDVFNEELGDKTQKNSLSTQLSIASNTSDGSVSFINFFYILCNNILNVF